MADQVLARRPAPVVVAEPDRGAGPGRTRWRGLAGVVLPLAVVLIAAAALLARPVTTPTREGVAWPRPPSTPWARVSPSVFGPGSAISGVAVAGELLVAVGTDGRTSAHGFVRPGVWTARSPDRWERAELGAVALDPVWSRAGVRMHDVAAGGGVLVAVGEANVAPRTVGAAWTSEDHGRTWSVTSVGGDLDRAYAAPFAVTATGTGFVAVGGGVDTPAAWTSADGLAWTRAEMQPGSGGLVDVVAGRAGLVAVDRGGRLWHSSAGDRWGRVVAYRRHPDVRVRGVTTAPDGTFVAVGSRGPDGARDGLVLHSEDGRNWSEAVSPLGLVPGSADVVLTGLIPSAAVGAVAVGDTGGHATAFSAAGGVGWQAESLPALPDAPSAAALAVRWQGADLAIGFTDGWDGRHATIWLRTPPRDADGAGAVQGGAPDLVVAVGDAGLWVTDARDRSAVDLPLEALGVEDPRVGSVAVGDALVVRAGGEVRAVVADAGAPGSGPLFTTRPLGRASYAVASGRPGRVWLVTVLGGAGLAAREVTVDGEVTVPPTALPAGAQPLVGVGDHLVVHGREGWSLWSPTGGDAVALAHVARVLAADGPLLAWCESDGCARVLVGRAGDVRGRPLAAGPAGTGVIGATIAPGGRWIATIVSTSGREPQDVVITDLQTGSVALAAEDLAYPQIAWDPTGSRLTVWEQRGVLRSLDPGAGTSQVLGLTLGRGTVHSLDVLAAR